MNQNPLVSVIMSVFNGEKYLHEAVNSILKQTYQHFEFIIIDDSSTDTTFDILQSYKKKDARIIIIRKEKNYGAKGFIENLNIGLEHSKGQYIARMDADDISHTERLRLQVNFLHENPEIFLVGSNVETLDGGGNRTGILNAPAEDSAIKKSMIKKISLYHPVIMFRNIPNIYYRPKMLYCEDYDLYFRLMTGGYLFANLENPLLKYRILPHSISRQNHQLIRWLFVEKCRAFYKERREIGTDSYNKFEPDNYLNIFNIKYKNSLEDLLFAARTAFKYNATSDLQQIIEKAEFFYQGTSRFKKYKIALKFPKIVLPYLSKLN